jgi:hypothetical protein
MCPLTFWPRMDIRINRPKGVNESMTWPPLLPSGTNFILRMLMNTLLYYGSLMNSTSVER